MLLCVEHDRLQPFNDEAAPVVGRFRIPANRAGQVFKKLGI